MLACCYCATTDHNVLGTLVTDDKTTRFSVNTCRQCSGYLKSCTTLQATPADSILAVDLASVAFDVAAVERGFLRPQGPAIALGAKLANDFRLPAEPAASVPARSARWGF